MATLKISLSDSLRDWVEAQVKSREYADASDYIRDLIRHDMRQRDALRLALIEGEQSGRSKRTVKDIMRVLHQSMDTERHLGRDGR
jgi:antitoxin ParD1/3/4